MVSSIREAEEKLIPKIKFLNTKGKQRRIINKILPRSKRRLNDIVRLRPSTVDVFTLARVKTQILHTYITEVLKKKLCKDEIKKQIESGVPEYIMRALYNEADRLKGGFPEYTYIMVRFGRTKIYKKYLEHYKKWNIYYLLYLVDSELLEYDYNSKRYRAKTN